MPPRTPRLIAAAFLILALAVGRAAPAPPAEPPNLSALKDELLAYIDDGGYAERTFKLPNPFYLTK